MREEIHSTRLLDLKDGRFVLEINVNKTFCLPQAKMAPVTHNVIIEY